MSRTDIPVVVAALLFVSAPVSAEMPPAVAAPAAMEHSGHDHGGDHGEQGRQGAREWTTYPLVERAMGKGMDERSAVLLNSKNLNPDKLLSYAPNGSGAQELERTLSGAKLTPLPKVGNYYWVAAREEQADKVVVATTAYYFGNPDGPGPTKMLLVRKNELELIPQPLPRAHSNYRENEDWKFLLRFNGEPLPGQTVRLETQNGSKLSFTSDAQGMVSVRFPADYRPADEKKEGGDGWQNRMPRRAAAFVLETEHTESGKQYVTAFNYSYGPDAYTTRSLAWGAGFALFGMVLASPLLRRNAGSRKDKAAVEEGAAVSDAVAGNNDSSKGV